MNYINKLQNKVEEAHNSNHQAADLVQELFMYLYSPKFHNDTTVQVKDVLNRLDSIRGKISLTEDILES